MDEHYLKIYRYEALIQIDYAEKMYKSIEATDSVEERLMFIQFFVICTYNVFKILFPYPKDDKFKVHRAKSLRIKYGIPEIDQKIISIRNDFEHYDDRIDNWVINSKSHNYIDTNEGPYNSINVNVKDPSDRLDRFRHYDPTKKTVYFQDKEYNLEELLRIILEVKANFGIT